MKRVLFVCSRNKLRSPTAEQVFSNRPGFEVSSAGTDRTAATPISSDLIEWAEVIFVMERAHRIKLAKNFRNHLKNKRIICLDIPDDFDSWIPNSFDCWNRKSVRSSVVAGRRHNRMPSLDLYPSERFKWIIVVLFVAMGLGAASKAPYSVGLLRPCLLLLIWAIWLKITLEHGWKLPMRLFHFVRMEPEKRNARNRLLMLTSLIAVLLTLAIVGPLLPDR